MYKKTFNYQQKTALKKRKAIEKRDYEYIDERSEEQCKEDFLKHKESLLRKNQKKGGGFK